MINGQPPYNSLPSNEAEGKENVETYLGQGLELIKSDQYQEAIQLLIKCKPFLKAGIEHFQPTGIGIYYKLPKEQQIDEFVERSGLSFYFHCGIPTIENATNYIAILHPKEFNIPEPTTEAYHTIALNCVEGYLDALRYLNGEKPLAGYENQIADNVQYLYQHGVPMTRRFLQAHRVMKDDAQKRIPYLPSRKPNLPQRELINESMGFLP